MTNIQQHKKEWDAKLYFGLRDEASTLKEYCAERERALLEEVMRMCERMKFKSVNKGDKEMRYIEYSNAKPVHESSEIFMQYAYNQALSLLITSLKDEIKR